jgi:hypothetical protein
VIFGYFPIELYAASNSLLLASRMMHRHEIAGGRQDSHVGYGEVHGHGGNRYPLAIGVSAPSVQKISERSQAA